MGAHLQSVFTFSTKARGFVLAASLLASANPRSSVTEIISRLISVHTISFVCLRSLKLWGEGLSSRPAKVPSGQIGSRRETVGSTVGGDGLHGVRTV